MVKLWVGNAGEAASSAGGSGGKVAAGGAGRAGSAAWESVIAKDDLLLITRQPLLSAGAWDSGDCNLACCNATESMPSPRCNPRVCIERMGSLESPSRAC